MRNLVYLLSSIALLLACSKKPKQLSRNAMKEIMWELLNAEELMKINANNDSTYIIKKNRPLYYQKVFLVHQISQNDFDKNFLYYQTNPNEMKILLDSVSNFGIRKREKAISK